MKADKVSQTKESPGALLQKPTKPRHRILVVEDDGDIRQINTEALTRCGYQVDTAGDGASAWNILQIGGYDLMVTDNVMPKVTGVELLKKIHAAHMALPVVMATGTLPREEFIRHPWLQPAAMLLKPYTIDELVVTVHEVLRVTDGSSGRTAPPSTWRYQVSTEDWHQLLLRLRQNDS
jgi:DNA-binding response OmpR family regulator